MQEFIDNIHVMKWSEHLFDWLQTDVFVATTLLQISILAATLFTAIILSRWVSHLFRRISHKFSFMRGGAVVAAKQNITLPLSWLILQLLVLTILGQVNNPSGIISIVANLTAAWVAIRFFSSFMKNPAFSRVIAVVGWGIAALNILGWLDPTVSFLDAFAFEAGEFRISLLTVIKGLITFGALFWAAIAISNVSDRQIRNVSGLTPSLQVLLSKLIKIALIAFAILFGISSIGIDITALAVFSGAVGVGIGFGLQKIVSNFISGIILLVDRSIKPGDVIEVDNTYGWINKLSGRHVSVITRDGKEHLIPNEDLITQRVINWSYSSKAVRLKIPVGISYKADPHMAKKVILDSVVDIGRVLDTPKPVCLITGFGDSAVDLELRVWIEDPSNGVSNVQSQILFAIWDKFKEHNIEIPFPQRDVHIDGDALENLANQLKTS